MNIFHIYSIFEQAIEQYHILDEIDQSYTQPYPVDTLDALLFQKIWTDTMQWHCEDEVRNPAILAEKVQYFKQKIDHLNQQRTNMVEQLDDYFLEKYQGIVPSPSARLNTESPAWAIDRLAILALKIYHMEREVERKDLTEIQRVNYTAKLRLLLTQKQDLTDAITQLLADIEAGQAIYKVYRQVKMYNDNDLNPVLRNSK